MKQIFEIAILNNPKKWSYLVIAPNPSIYLFLFPNIRTLKGTFTLSLCYFNMETIFGFL